MNAYGLVGSTVISQQVHLGFDIRGVAAQVLCV